MEDVARSFDRSCVGDMAMLDSQKLGNGRIDRGRCRGNLCLDCPVTSRRYHPQIVPDMSRALICPCPFNLRYHVDHSSIAIVPLLTRFDLEQDCQGTDQMPSSRHSQTDHASASATGVHVHIKSTSSLDKYPGM